VPPLPRANYDVRRVAAGPSAVRLVRDTPFDLLVLVLPFASAARLLSVARTASSPCRRAAVLVIADERLEPDRLVTELANRILAPDCPPEELLGAAQALLDVAP